MIDRAAGRCRTCNRAFPLYYLSAGRCDACHWDCYVPPGHERRERYRFDPGWGHDNATRRPPLEVDFLDSPVPRVSTTMLRNSHKPKW